MADISAVFEVNGSHVIDFTADVHGLDPEQIADLVYQSDPGISVCHQCAHEIDDPESGDLAGFTVDGVEYHQVNGEWVKTGA